jgi:hypothetical protein
MKMLLYYPCQIKYLASTKTQKGCLAGYQKIGWDPSQITISKIWVKKDPFGQKILCGKRSLYVKYI